MEKKITINIKTLGFFEIEGLDDLHARKVKEHVLKAVLDAMNDAVSVLENETVQDESTFISRDDYQQYLPEKLKERLKEGDGPKIEKKAVNTAIAFVKSYYSLILAKNYYTSLRSGFLDLTHFAPVTVEEIFKRSDRNLQMVHYCVILTVYLIYEQMPDVIIPEKIMRAYEAMKHVWDKNTCP